MHAQELSTPRSGLFELPEAHVFERDGHGIPTRTAAAGVVLEIEYHLVLAVQANQPRVQRIADARIRNQDRLTHFIRAAAVIGVDRLAVIETPHLGRGHGCGVDAVGRHRAVIARLAAWRAGWLML